MSFSLLILFLPLIGAIATGGFSKYLGPTLSVRLPVACLFFAMLSVIPVGMAFLQDPTPTVIPLIHWMHWGDLKITWQLYVDRLAVVMMGMVTTVSFLVHVYSLGYMKEDPNQARFMAYLNLFTFMMLLLVMAGDMIQLFVGWEGVGLCSYLLIGFWFEKKAPTYAALKAFLVNRVGDVFLVLSLGGLFCLYGTLSFEGLATAPDPAYSGLTELLVGFGLLLAAMAKSAQLGLHVWLPDAMEGPTPVSALIHAATMVTAGIFLLMRFEPFLQHLPMVLETIAIVGASTALFGSVMALFQRDLKRIISYSTCSQLGYMILAVGLSAHGAALFHMVTHGFFKALLFLGAGSVIHIYKGEKNIARMGSLGLKAPVTYGSLLVGVLSLTGMPYFAGYFSKDLILEHAYHRGHGLVFPLALVAVFFTGLYATRLMMRVFHRQNGTRPSFKESPHTFLIPLSLLGVLSILVGYLGHVSWGQELLRLERIGEGSIVPYMVLGTGLFGIVIGGVAYGFLPHMSAVFQEKLPHLYRFGTQQAYVDSLYGWLFVKPFRIGAKKLAHSDVAHVDFYGPMGVARLLKRMNAFLLKLQTGYVFHYVLWMLTGLVGILVYYLVR